MNKFLLIVLLMIPLAGFSGSERLNYQGKLAQGNNLVTGTVPMTFQIFDGQNGTNVLYEESMDVDVVDGYYSVELGEHPNLGQLIRAIKRENAHIQVVVNGNTLRPRERIGKPPFAEHSTEHWTIFGFYDNNGGGVKPEDYSYLEQTTQTVAIALNNLTACEYFVVNAYGDCAYAIFPPTYEQKEVVKVRIRCRQLVTSSPEAGNYPAVTLKTRNLDSGLVNKILADKVDISAAQSGWLSIPLTENVDDKTLSENDALELFFSQENISGHTGNQVKDLLIDVMVQ